MLTNRRYVVRSPAVVHETIDGEAVIINLETGAYFSVEGRGAIAWQQLVAGASPADVATMLAAGHDGDAGAIAAAVAQLVDSLRREGLIRPDDPADGDPPAPAAAAPNPGLADLSLRVFTDLQELLLLDPIHDVDEVGWPAPLPRR
jgi:coenzyme PQQ synthesis protein D (PqqD)